MVTSRCHPEGASTRAVRGWTASALALLAVLSFAADAQAGRSTPATPAAADADSAVAGEVPEELQDVLPELEAADQPPTRRELAAAGVTDGSAARGVSGRRFGSVLWRAATGSQGMRHDGRFSANAELLRGRVTVRLRPEAAPAVSGAGSLGRGAIRGWFGHLGLRHGYGLALGDAARRGSLAADQRFGGQAGGLVPRTAAGSGEAGTQAGISCGAGPWEADVLAAAGPGPVSWAVRVARGGGGGQLSVLAVTDTLSERASLAGVMARDNLDAGWEALVARPHAGAATLAVVTHLGWQVMPGLRLELASGLAQGTTRAAVPVLPTGADRGWALRLAWSERGIGALEILAHGADTAPASTVALRRQVGILEAAWERRVGPGLSAFARCRRAARSDQVWSERAPWLPPTLEPAAARTLLHAGMEADDGSRRASLHWRSFTSEGTATTGNRQAISATAARHWRSGWSLWADATSAWGDPVDLVRGLSPVPGLVLPRHWGAWRSEVLLGMGRKWGSLQVHLALARRLPDPVAGAVAGSVEGWLEARGSF